MDADLTCKIHGLKDHVAPTVSLAFTEIRLHGRRRLLQVVYNYLPTPYRAMLIYTLAVTIPWQPKTPTSEDTHQTDEVPRRRTTKTERPGGHIGYSVISNHDYTFEIPALLPLRKNPVLCHILLPEQILLRRCQSNPWCVHKKKYHRITVCSVNSPHRTQSYRHTP